MINSPKLKGYHVLGIAFIPAKCLSYEFLKVPNVEYFLETSYKVQLLHILCAFSLRARLGGWWVGEPPSFAPPQLVDIQRQMSFIYA